MKQCLFYVMFLVLAHSLTAQPPDTIAYSKSFLGVHKYYKPAAGRYKPGVVKKMLLSQPASAVYFHKYRAETWTGIGCGLTGVALSYYGQQDNVRLRYLRKANPYHIASTAVLGSCIYLLLHSMKHLHRSVKAYNRTVQQQW
jgi:hypothetical protein